MLIFESLKASAEQLRQRQLHQAERMQLIHAAAWEELQAEQEYHASMARMYQDRASRIKAGLKVEVAS